MKISDKGKRLMHQFEGIRYRPYLCPAHVWTIGAGSVLYQDQIRLPVARIGASVNAPMIRKEYPLRQEHNRVWSKEEIDQLFAADLRTFERGVLRLVPGCDGVQGAFDALVSLAYNIGLGNLQRSQVRIRANRQDWPGAAEALLAWSKAGGKVLPGLLRRRQAEAALMIA